jgi:hypothetical protein
MSRAFRLALLISVYLVVLIIPVFAGDDWLPVSKEDLAMKDYAAMPGQHAVILYRKVERNDKDSWEKQYFRIKILDEEGKKYANVETEAYSKQYKLDNIQARSIKPDGTIVPFTGKVFDKLIAKYKNFSIYAKTFTIPDVQAGSIIEYRFTYHWDSMILMDSSWTVQNELATRDADFSLKAYQSEGYGNDYNLSWMIFFVPKNEQPKEDKGIVTMTVHNVPPLEKEEYMPPIKELQARVEFNYSDANRPKDGEEYWNKEAVRWSKGTESYLGKPKAIQNVVASLVAAGDTPEIKLKKLYDHIQKMRNLTYERSKADKEAKAEKLKDNKNIEDILKHGYGNQNELNNAFVALARAAGFPATLIRITERDQSFTHKEIWKIERFNTEIAIVTLNGKQVYLDPGVPYCPFGILSWEDTGVTGLLLDNNKAVWGDTPQPLPQESVERRVADMTLDRDGNLSGEITVIYEGREALWRRLASREDDDAERKKDLEKMFKNLMPTGATVELGKIDDWNAATDRFTVTAKVTLPSFAASTAKRMMVPISVFSGADSHPFTHARRVNPVYFHNPYEEIDQIKIKLPEGMQPESIPQPRTLPTQFAEMKMTTEKDNQSIKIERDVIMNGYFFRPEFYPSLREFLDKVKAVGDEQAVLRAAAK